MFVLSFGQFGSVEMLRFLTEYKFFLLCRWCLEGRIGPIFCRYCKMRKKDPSFNVGTMCLTWRWWSCAPLLVGGLVMDSLSLDKSIMVVRNVDVGVCFLSLDRFGCNIYKDGKHNGCLALVEDSSFDRVLASQICTTMSIATYTKIPICMLKTVKKLWILQCKEVTVAVRETLVCPSKIHNLNSWGSGQDQILLMLQFRDNIRYINNHLSFTSLYCRLDSMTTNIRKSYVCTFMILLTICWISFQSFQECKGAPPEKGNWPMNPFPI